jgi:raffinose/stachyose/melibiose transport system substrate-binding protein
MSNAIYSQLPSENENFPENLAELDYSAMQQMFGSGNAAMFIGGSWEISEYEELGSNSSQIDWFAPPVVADGDKQQYCFHVDADGVNKNSKNIEASLTYIKWISGSEYAHAIMDELLGFFSYTPRNVYLDNPLTKKIFDASATADITVRLMCEKLSTQSPSGSKLMTETLNEIMLGNYTPETASAYVQNELDKWYLSEK